MRTLITAGGMLAAAGLTLSLMSAPAIAASDTGTASTSAAQGKPPKAGKGSVKCNENSSRINFSWKTGYASTKVYYNNHCLGGFKTKVAFKFWNDGSTPWYKCVSFEGMTKGTYKFAHINPIMGVSKDTKKCEKN
ncbi:hypothetical protein ACH4TX_22740 [Streptomyces sp. NPDC021098]|uniref:hypothetical protein n=1 Tax=unclassified Streptomyces TaxID=2593676 RepID=UPI00379B87E4